MLHGTIPCPGLSGVYDVAEMTNGDLVIATHTGLYHLDATGSTTRSTIDAGGFGRVVIYQDEVFAAEHYSATIHKYSYRGNWQQRHSFKHFEVSRRWTTLSVKNNKIKCCSSRGNSIHEYSLDGELLQMYGTEGRRGVGQLESLFICDDDEDGSILIADNINNTLQVMTEKGEFSVLQIQPPVLGPRGAVLFNNQLYIISDQTDTIAKYTC